VATEATGVFVDAPSDQQPSNSSPNSPEEQKIVDIVVGDYQIFRAKRQNIEETWREEDRFYEGGRRHWEGLRSEATMKNRPNSTDNIAFSQIESIVSALTGWTPEGKFEATEQGDEEKSQEITRFMPFELRQIKFKAKYTKAVRRFINHGLFLTKQVYDPTIEGGRGANRWIGQNDVIPMDYGTFFPDPRIGDLLYLQRGKAHIIHTRKEIEYFPERWPKQGKKVQEDNYSGDVEIFEQDRAESQRYFSTTDVSGTTGTEKQKKAGLIEYWYKGKPKMMTAVDKKLFRDMAEEKLAEGIDPTDDLAKAEGKAKGVHCIYISTSGVFLEHKSYVYDHGQYPIVARCLFPVEGSLWPKGYMRDLISPQIMLNKFSELAVEQTAKMGNGAIIYEEGSIAESKIPIWKRIRSTVGAMLPVIRKDGIQEIEGKGPPVMIMNFIDHWLNILQKIPRRYDSTNGGANFQGESGRHAEALQSAAQGNLSTATELLEDGLAEMFEQLIELIAQFYNRERIGRVLGKSVSVGRSQIVSRSPVDFPTGNTVPDQMGQMVPEVAQLNEEYVPQFDIKVSIGVERPMDREYWVQTALTLFKTIDPLTGLPMIDAEAVQYVMENGRMEPFEVIKERMQRDQQLMQQMQQLQAENQQLQGQLQQAGSQLQQADQAKIHAEMQKNSHDQQNTQNQQALDWAKLQQQSDQHATTSAIQMQKENQPVGMR
jgi:hypothetical protein